MKMKIMRKSNLVDEEIDILVSGLNPYETVKLCAEAKDHINRTWTSYAVFKSDANGILDLKKMEPIEGTYSGYRKDGLIYSLSLQKDEQNGDPAVAVNFLPVFFIAGINSFNIAFRLYSGGQLLAEESIVLEFASPEIEITEIQHPFIGKYSRPKGKKELPALLVLGGSSGGFIWSEQVASVLASRGYATLALSYFDYQGAYGLPQSLTEIPLEYFNSAIKWLKEQKEIKGEKVSVIGISKGGEASLVIGSVFNSDINSIVSFVPSSHVFESCVMGNKISKSSWSFNNQPVPFLPYPEDTIFSMDMDPTQIRPPHEKAFDQATPEQISNSRIAVEKCNCPILLISAGKDTTWHSAEMCETIMNDLQKFQYPFEYKHLLFKEAGHPFFLPGIPPYIDNPVAKPDTFAAANREAWDNLLSFLGKLK